MLTRSLILSAIGLVLIMGAGFYLNHLQAVPTFMSERAVEDGTKPTVLVQITPLESPTTTYRNHFIQGERVVPEAIEQQVSGMQPGERKTFTLSAEEGFGVYDATKMQTIPTADLPADAQEGDMVDDDAGRMAKIVRIAPDTTVLDLNHPLAGQPLMVTLRIVNAEIPDDVDETSMRDKRESS